MSRTIADLLLAQADSDRPAVLDGDRSLSYRDLTTGAQRLATRITKADPSGANVALLLPNSDTFVVAYFAAHIAGRTVVPVHPATGPDELVSTLDYCDVVVVLSDENGLARLTATPLARRVIVITHARSQLVGPASDAATGRHASLGRDYDTDGVAVLLHTSGTSGRPKRVMLSHRALLANVEAVIAAHRYTSDDVSLVSLPMTFGYCHTAQLLTHVALGATVAIAPAPFVPAHLCTAIERHGVTNYTAVPANLLMLRTYRGFSGHDLSTLRTVCFGGAPLEPAVFTQLCDLLPGVEFVQTYGQTEAGPRITAMAMADAVGHPRSVGLPLPGVALRICLDGATAPDGVIGEVVVASPSLMDGYYRRPEDSARVLRAGELWTGDLGFLHDGYLHLAGRLSNVINSGGVNLYPEEIEECLRAAPGVIDARVYAQPHEMLGEIPVADVILEQGTALASVRSYVRHHLADYKVPHRLRRVPDLPRTVTGKLRRDAVSAPREDRDVVPDAPSVIVVVYPESAGRHGALVDALARVLDTPPDPEQFVRHCANCSSASHGAPALLDEPDLALSLSYGPGVIVVALGRGIALGVDIAPTTPIKHAEAISQRFFAPAERDALASAPDPAAMFAWLWSRKEACVKALGVGILYPMTSFSTVEDLVDITAKSTPRPLALTTVPVEAAVISVAATPGAGVTVTNLEAPC